MRFPNLSRPLSGASPRKCAAKPEPIHWRDLWPFAIAPAVAACLYVAHVMGWAG